MRRRLWLAAAFLFVAGDAMAFQIRGALLASVESSFRVSESALGLVAPAGTVGFVVAILAVGLLAGRLDVRRTLLIGVTVTFVALVALWLAPVYALFLLALVVQSVGAGVFRAMDRPLLSHLYPGRLGRVFVLYGLAWALGAVSGPVVVTVVLRVWPWQATFALVALWFLPILALLWWLDPPSGWDERTLDREALGRLLDDPAVRLAVVGMALVGGVEGTVFTWLPYYVGHLHERELATLSLSVFLLAYVPGRYAYSRLVERTSYRRLSLATTALAVPAFTVALGGARGVTLFVAIFLAGLLVSSLFPLLSAYGVAAAPEYSGPLSALTTAATYAGIAVVPVVVGVVAELAGVQVAMLVPVALIALLAVVLWASPTGVEGEREAAPSSWPR